MIICPKCGSDSRVTDSRPVYNTHSRRRECIKCKERWTTHEVTLPAGLNVDPTADIIGAFERARAIMAQAAAKLEALEADLRAKPKMNPEREHKPGKPAARVRT